MSIGVFSLATGILLGSGWLGTTCLDEWQIGILGVAAGFTIFLSGGGKYSVDHLIERKFSLKKKAAWLSWLTSGELPVSAKRFANVSVAGAIVIFTLSLYTNQEFHAMTDRLLSSLKRISALSDGRPSTFLRRKGRW